MGTKILHAPRCSKKKKSTASKAYCLPKFHLFTLLSNFYMSPKEDNCPSLLLPTHFRGTLGLTQKEITIGIILQGSSAVSQQYIPLKKLVSTIAKTKRPLKYREGMTQKSGSTNTSQKIASRFRIAALSQVLATKIRETLASSLRTV